jgi:beta-glucosidase
VDLLHEMGQALAEEAIALKVDVLLGPGANMKRTPLCGRNFEYFAEDPYLAGQMAASLINGIQSKGVGTSLKHFAANNQEFERFAISAEVDERTLREIYLPAFETAVTQAKPWTVMCAYNKLNGTYASEHHRLLTDILKNEWGFEGFVVSDWGAVHNRVASLRAGLDLEMPGPKQRARQCRHRSGAQWPAGRSRAGRSGAAHFAHRVLRGANAQRRRRLTRRPTTTWRVKSPPKAWCC